MPKSSIPTSMPAARREARTAITSTSVWRIRPSVISIIRLCRGMDGSQARAIHDSLESAASGRNWTGDTFTLTWKPGTRAAHRAAHRAASWKTQSPSGTIRPVSSAIGMNSSGWMIPRTGWSQRTSASAL